MSKYGMVEGGRTALMPKKVGVYSTHVDQETERTVGDCGIGGHESGGKPDAIAG